MCVCQSAGEGEDGPLHPGDRTTSNQCKLAGGTGSLHRVMFSLEELVLKRIA